MTIQAILPELRSHRILGVADPAKVAACLCEKSLQISLTEAGEEICSPESRPHFVGILLEGRATVNSADGARAVRLRTVGKGATFGVATLFAEENPFPTRITAATRCRVLLIEAAAFRRLLLADRAAAEAFMTFLCDRIVYLNKKIASFTAGSAERRLALFLCDNECDGICSIDVSYSTLSEMLDIGRASLYRALDALEAEGLILRRDRTVTLTDKQALLAKYSCG